MSEFKIIPSATAYEINIDAEIRKVADKKPIVVSKDGKAMLKKDDGGWDHFVAADLAKELFYTMLEYKAPPSNDGDTGERKDADPIQDGEKPKSKSKREKFAWTFIGKTGAGKPPKETSSKKQEKEKSVHDAAFLAAAIGSASVKPGNPYTLTDDKKEIVEKKCSESIKLWKLHKLGCSTDEILFHLKQPATKAHSFNSIIWRYKQNKKLMDRADSK